MFEVNLSHYGNYFRFVRLNLNSLHEARYEKLKELRRYNPMQYGWCGGLHKKELDIFKGLPERTLYNYGVIPP